MLKLSIIVPVYNVEPYIRPCFESILNQGLDENDYEVIIVDDCGTDRSMETILELKETHSKGNHVRIIKHEQNKGLAEARNTAIKNARSKYIFFVDFKKRDFGLIMNHYHLKQITQKDKQDISFLYFFHFQINIF